MTPILLRISWYRSSGYLFSLALTHIVYDCSMIATRAFSYFPLVSPSTRFLKVDLYRLWYWLLMAPNRCRFQWHRTNR